MNRTLALSHVVISLLDPDLSHIHGGSAYFSFRDLN